MGTAMGDGVSGGDALANPILNSPFHPPQQHFEIGPNGPTGLILSGRRPSESFIPIPPSRKGKAAQGVMDFDPAGERREENSLINDIRFRVDRWRIHGYNGATPISRKLMRYWAGLDTNRDDPVLFCQREAAETAIYLAEVAGRHGEPDFRTRIDPQNRDHNAGLPRTALKMATGAGKTVVMAMLIAWQTANKVASPRDARFAKRFLVITPGITIRDRLRVLQPEDPGNYYRERDLVPPDLWPYLLEARVAITNFHTFQLKDAKEIRGVAANTRKLLNAGKATDPFKETAADMVSRVLRDFGGGAGTKRSAGGELVVFNDEAHHCYIDKPIDAADPAEMGDKEDRDRNEQARVWFRGLQAIDAKVGLKAVYDLSATPFYLHGSGYNEGFIFPWAVSDFSLMDAIESGIVKVPRVPVDDDAAGDLPTYKHLWDHVGDKLPKSLNRAKKAQAGNGAEEWVPPEVLEGALESLHRSYRRRFEQWGRELSALGEPPPVLIVVCPNTAVSKLVYDWVAGRQVERDDGTTVATPGRLPLLSNVVNGHWLARPRTILIDSAALESGDALKDDFKQAARVEIDAFKAEYRRRNPGADVDKLGDEDLLREVMNTVGKRGMLGEQVRCVVSVSMLTEGWDANTVTHILGVRAFRSQLLCEQVVGRGLRRRSYATNEQGFFEPEYAEVYGVPFAFISNDRPPGPEPPPRPPAIEVRALPDRADLAITFPKLLGYRLELADQLPFGDFDADAHLHVTRNEVAVWVENQGIAGQAEEVDLKELRLARPQRVAFEIARVLVTRHLTGLGDDPKPWLFPRLVELAKQWLDECVTFSDDAFCGLLLISAGKHRAAEKLFGALLRQEDSPREELRPMLRPFDSEGSTAEVTFVTRKHVVGATKSHVNFVVLDGAKGNSWEEGVAAILEGHGKVAAYVKNDHLGFEIPYVHEGRSHAYVPDFLVRLVDDSYSDGVARTLIVEVSGSHKSPGPTQAKAATARDEWCTAVNNHGGWGRWGYVEIGEIARAGPLLNRAIDDLFAHPPLAGSTQLEAPV